ncbi:CHASE3 domain-containing protein [Roseibium sp. M-1]
MKFLADLPIAVRVGALSAITIVAIGVLLGTSFYSQKIVSTEIDNLAEYSQMDYYVSQVQAHAQNMRRSQKDFLLTKDPAFVEEYNAEFDEAKTRLGDVEAKDQSAPVKGNISSLHKVLDEHQAQFVILSGRWAWTRTAAFRVRCALRCRMWRRGWMPQISTL